jgi:hypothetical protein
MHSKDLLFISRYNFSSLERKLIKKGWLIREARETLEQYKKYMLLKKKYFHQYQLPPSIEIDEVWHIHILDTQEYFNFCFGLFGFYLHHCPEIKTSAGQELTKDEVLILYREHTQKLYLEEFGEPIFTVRRGFLAKILDLTLVFCSSLNELTDRLSGVFAKLPK